VHVPLRGSQISVARQLLDGTSRRPAHREVRTKRVPKNVNSLVLQLCHARGMVDVIPDDLLVDC
jgi:hypothetical protein